MRVAQTAAGRLAETGMRAEGECLPASVEPFIFFNLCRRNTI
jgi:hypothetical protein